MASTKTGNTAEKPNLQPVPDAGKKPPQAPEGFKRGEQQTELAGYWLPDKGPIWGKLHAAFDYKQKQGKGRGQIRRVYVIETAAPCVCTVVTEGPDGKGKTVEEGTLPERSMVGVFRSAGIRELDEPQGAFVWIAPMLDKSGKQMTKEVGQGDMKLFDVQWKGTPKPLKLRAAPKQAEEQHNEVGSKTGGNEDDELPF